MTLWRILIALEIPKSNLKNCISAYQRYTINRWIHRERIIERVENLSNSKHNSSTLLRIPTIFMPLLPIEFHCRRRNITRKHQRSLLRFAFQAGPPWKNQSLCVRLVWFATPDKFPFAFIEGCKKIGRNNIEFIYLHQFTVLFSTLEIKPEPRQSASIIFEI